MTYATQFVIDWIARMAGKYGGIVYDINGQSYDWGQSLCREQYGEGWNNYIATHEIDEPDNESIRLAKAWEAGTIPAWVRTSKEVA